MLSVVASSMITVAGVVFSIMMVVLSLAAQQYGPRLLRNFMRDQVTQTVLGVFVSTFLYCVLVLRTIRGGNEEFVPQISVTFGVALSIVSLSVLIYFIHHVSVSIHIGEIISRVQSELLAAIDELFPESLGEEGSRPEENTANAPLDVFESDSVPVLGAASGYLEAVDDEKLLATAKRFDLVARLLVKPGDYCLKKQPLLLVGPAQRVSPEASSGFQDSFVLGSQRTPVQDVLFALERQADIAIRALSPGINDPLTAIDCLEHLNEALRRLAERRIPSAFRQDEDGRLRIIAPQIAFKNMLDRSIGLVRQYGDDHAEVTLKLLEIIASLFGHVRRSSDAAAVAEQLEAIATASYENISSYDRGRVQSRIDEIERQLQRAANSKTPS